MGTFSWSCPFCNQTATISQDYNMDFFDGIKYKESVEGRVKISGYFIVCPNTACNKFTLIVHLYEGKQVPNHQGTFEYKKILNTWPLIPQSNAKVYPEYIPKTIKNDYEEACLILNLSPKASATLARRCLQGMIRDFYSIKKPADFKGVWTLYNEIDAIKEKIDSDIWSAINGVRSVGNIGAHMETDINLIIDVDAGEASKLIELIELLIEEWYINRHKRQQKVANVIEIAKKKKEQKNTTSH